MDLVPRTKNGKIQFYKSRLQKWTERAVEIGTTPEAVADLVAKTDLARQAYAEQRAALQVARAATGKLDEAIDKMTTAGASIIKQIRAKADLAGTGIYPKASIRKPAKPSPTKAPGKPDQLDVSLCAAGRLMLKWTCDNPRGTKGTMYHVWRSIGPEERYVFIGTSGAKRFTDDTLPAGTSLVLYRIQAVRTTKAGAAAEFIVRIGGAQRDMTTAIVTTQEPARVQIAA